MQRLETLEARRAIDDLLVRYSLARDGNRLDELLELFTDTAQFIRAGRVVSGRAGIEEFFQGSMNRYRRTLHTNHGSVVEVDGDRASGTVLGHAELVLPEHVVVCAYRYQDEYRLDGGRWRIHRRHLEFDYAVPAREYPTALLEERCIRWPGQEPALPDAR